MTFLNIQTVDENILSDVDNFDALKNIGHSYRSDHKGSEVPKMDDVKINLRSLGHLYNKYASSNAIPISSFTREEIRQKWSGTVLECDEHVFTARIEDLTQPNLPDEIVEIEIDAIEARDRNLIKAGAIFLWQIGYRTGMKVSRENFQSIRFRRLPKWSEHEILESDKLAKQYFDFFNQTEA